MPYLWCSSTVCLTLIALIPHSTVAGIYIGHCLFAVKPNLAVGAEALFQRVLHPALGQVVSQLSGGLVAKYNGKVQFVSVSQTVATYCTRSVFYTDCCD